MNGARLSTEWRDKVPLGRLLAESSIVGREFYARPAAEVARGLLGAVLVHGRTAGMIVEAEAYLGLKDLAAHASRGITNRTKVLFGPPGHAYVYFIYGMHECLNLVAEPDGTPGCVLIRAVEPLSGIAIMRKRRPGARRLEDLSSGPGKLTQAFGITRRQYGADVTKGSLTVRRWRRQPNLAVEATPRIGIRHCADWPLRFAVKGNPFISRPSVAR